MKQAVYQCLSVKLSVHDLTPEESLFVYVVLQRLDVEKETIELVHTKPTETHELPYRIPTDSPRYHFFIFRHSHQGQRQEALGQFTFSLLVKFKYLKIIEFLFIIYFFFLVCCT